MTPRPFLTPADREPWQASRAAFSADVRRYLKPPADPLHAAIQVIRVREIEARDKAHRRRLAELATLPD